MARHEQLTVGELTLSGAKNADGVKVLALDEFGKVLDCTGTIAAPSAKKGYAINCIYRRSDNATIYVNTGTVLSCSFENIQAVSAGEIALADGKVLIGGATGVGAAKTPTGDVTITNEGVTVIGANKIVTAMVQNASITGAKLASGAGVAALLAAGLGASATYAKATSGAQTLLASAAGARVVLIVVTVDETFAAGDTSATVFTIGETDTANKYAANTLLVSATAGSVFILAGTLTAAKALLVTGTAAAGTGTGGITVSALVLPAAA
jgi:hypothetical protein